MYTKKETTELIAAYQHTTTSYECSVCKQEFDDEDDVKHHYGEHHAVKEKRVAGHKAFYRFDTKEDFQAYVAHIVSDRRIDYTYVDHLSGVGWFAFEQGSQPCGKGCCYKDTLTAVALEGVRSSVENRLRSTTNELADLDAMIASVNGKENQS